MAAAGCATCGAGGGADSVTVANTASSMVEVRCESREYMASNLLRNAARDGWARRELVYRATLSRTPVANAS